MMKRFRYFLFFLFQRFSRSDYCNFYSFLYFKVLLLLFFLFCFIFQIVIEDFKNLQPSLSAPPSRPILQNLLTTPIPRTVASISNLREPLFAPFSWPRTTNPSSWTSNHPNSEVPRVSRPSTLSTLFSVDQLLRSVDSPRSRASAPTERPPRAAVSLPEETTLSLVVEPPVASSSVVHLEPRSGERQISRVDNPNSSPAIDVVTLSPLPLPTIDILPLETVEVSLSSSPSPPTNESPL
jgi:hypothetical protein